VSPMFAKNNKKYLLISLLVSVAVMYTSYSFGVAAKQLYDFYKSQTTWIAQYKLRLDAEMEPSPALLTIKREKPQLYIEIMTRQAASRHQAELLLRNGAETATTCYNSAWSMAAGAIGFFAASLALLVFTLSSIRKSVSAEPGDSED